jgi:hypothetical protein
MFAVPAAAVDWDRTDGESVANDATWLSADFHYDDQGTDWHRFPRACWPCGLDGFALCQSESNSKKGVRNTLHVPGTGISYQTKRVGASGCLVLLLGLPVPVLLVTILSHS